MYLIGLTGNIACGKSTVARMLVEHGAAICDADIVAHQVMQPGGPAYKAVVEAFGPSIIDEPGAPINRKTLGAIVFADPNALLLLEQLVHPRVREAIAAWIGEQRDAGVQVAVLEAIKLIEGGWPTICDQVWVTACQPAHQLQRLIADRGLSEEEARTRITAQGPQEAKLAAADVVIDTTGTLEQTQAQVDAAWQALTASRQRPDTTQDR